jgi:ketosteroid isomerase-like protein
VAAIDVLKQFLDSLETGDFATAAALLDPDVVVRASPDLPYGGDYVGLEGFGELGAKMIADLEFGNLAREEVQLDDERVVVFLKARFKGKATGEEAVIPIVEIYTIRDGRIVDVDPYYKTPAAIGRILPAKATAE